MAGVYPTSLMFPEVTFHQLLKAKYYLLLFRLVRTELMLRYPMGLIICMKICSVAPNPKR